jgi:hypothetical protein
VGSGDETMSDHSVLRHTGTDGFCGVVHAVSGVKFLDRQLG